MPDRSGGVTEATSASQLHEGKVFTDPLYKSVSEEKWCDKGCCGHLVGTALTLSRLACSNIQPSAGIA